VKVKGTTNAKQKTHVVQRPNEEWIGIEGACPRIIAEDVWQRAQSILNDPERIKQIPTPRFYMLRGRTKCGVCGSALVGQTLTVKQRPFKYYRCRHAYDKNTGHECSARYIRGNRLEQVVWNEVKGVLENPIVVLQELERRVEQDMDQDEIANVESELAKLTEREKRLVRLYTLGTVDEKAIKIESEEIGRERCVLEQKLSSMQQPVLMAGRNIDQEMLTQVCASVAHWLEEADESEQILALEALQIAVETTNNLAVVSGVLPIEAPQFIVSEQSCPCLYSGEYKQRVSV
jgi:hypothetical protein